MLVGPSGAGKSTFCEAYFTSNEVVSSDAIRQEYAGDFRSQEKNPAVFEEFHRRLRVRLRQCHRAVADATHLQDRDRRKTAEIGKELGVPVVYVVINRPLHEKSATAGWRSGVQIGAHSLVENHDSKFRQNEKRILSGDGLADVVVDIRTDEYVVEAGSGATKSYRSSIELPRDPKLVLGELQARGFNRIRVVGDVHGNLNGLSKAIEAPADTYFQFLGDLLDYGSDSLETVRIVAEMVREGRAGNLRGNHERKAYNYVTQERRDGFRGKISHGNAVTFNQLKAIGDEARRNWEDEYLELIDASPDHLVIKDSIRTWGFVHGAMAPYMLDEIEFRFGRTTHAESFALYGETMTDDKGQTLYEGDYPKRIYDWVDRLPAQSIVVVGHDIRSREAPFEQNGASGGRAVFLDTGSSKDGKLSWMDLNIEVQRDELVLAHQGYGSET